MDTPTRVGIMGFGHIGRHLYRLAMEGDDVAVVAISDIARPEILHYLLTSDRHNRCDVRLEGNYLVNDRFRSRLMCDSEPSSVPWDVFDVDVVVDATGRFNDRRSLQAHLDAGAPRVFTSILPAEPIDNLVMPGLNDRDARAEDRLISAGSSTTNALALLLTVLDQTLGVEAANAVSLHAYTSDQSLQDYAGKDYRRSRSGAENIIPNTNESAYWVTKLLPQFNGKLQCSALNVPIQKGSLLDLTVVFKDPNFEAEDVNNAIIDCTESYPHLLYAVSDPIVSSDVIGARQSAVFDLRATLKSGRRMVKTLSWYDNGLSHACRLLESLRLYRQLPPPTAPTGRQQ